MTLEDTTQCPIDTAVPVTIPVWKKLRKAAPAKEWICLNEKNDNYAVRFKIAA